MVCNFLNDSKINGYEIVVYFISPHQDFHFLGFFKDQHFKELNFPTSFHEHTPNLMILKIISCQQITQWELFHKSKDLSTNIVNLFLILKFSSKKRKLWMGMYVQKQTKW
jgi:hypothetical protein